MKLDTKTKIKFRTARYLKRFPSAPKEIIDLLVHQDVYNYEDALKFREHNIVSKKYIKIKCETCKNDYQTQIRTFVRRSTIEKICNKCYFIKYVYNNPIWIGKNRAAQIISQNKPETKQRNANSVRRFWKNNPEKLAAMGQKISDKFFNDEKYRDAVSGSRYKGFIFCNKFGKIKFDSLFELSYLIQCDKDPKIISLIRWTKGISYIDKKNTKHRYYPDFIVNETNVIELKGEHLLIRCKESIEIKIAAFKQQYPNLCFQMISGGIESKNFREICKMNNDINVVFHNIKVNDEYVRLKEKYANKK